MRKPYKAMGEEGPTTITSPAYQSCSGCTHYGSTPAMRGGRGCSYYHYCCHPVFEGTYDDSKMIGKSSGRPTTPRWCPVVDEAAGLTEAKFMRGETE